MAKATVETPGMSALGCPVGSSCIFREVCPSGAGLESQASSLTSLSPWASQSRTQNPLPLAARPQCLEQRAVLGSPGQGRPDGGGGFMRPFQTLS